MKQLTVLHINKLHYVLGGAEVIYLRTADMIEKHGHLSVFFSMRHPRNLPCETAEFFVPYIDLDIEGGVINCIKASMDVLYSLKARQYLSSLLDRYSVDIAHIHNIHRQMSPSILHELKKRKIPVVMTLHENHMICPSFRLLNHDKPCEACAGGKYFNAIKLRCIKDSYLRGALASLEMYLHQYILDIYDNVDIFISPSLFLKNKHKEMGFTKEIDHLPNPLDVQKIRMFKLEQKNTNDENLVPVVFCGRLIKEKGLFTLIKAAKLLLDENSKRKVEIRIIGDGPIREELKRKVKTGGIKNIRFLGFLKDEALYQEIKNALTVIVPSECYDTYPVAVMEAFALGKSVIGAKIGGIPEMVQDNVTGLTFEPGNVEDLKAKIRYIVNNPDKAAWMGAKAKSFVEQELDDEKIYEKLMELYNKAITKNSEKADN